MRRAGWEQNYVDYEKLKAIIDSVASSSDATSKFLAALTADIDKVNTFVKQQMVTLRADYAKAETDAELLKVRDDMTAVRHYVAINVIAATKIVKKHDKHVSLNLQKREAVAALVRGADGLSTLPAFHAELEKKFGSRGMPSSPQSVYVDVAVGNDDDDSTAALRSLPTWLLQGAQAEETTTKTFYTTYLADWTFDDPSGDEMLSQKLIGGSDAASEDLPEFDVNFDSSDVVNWSSLDGLAKLKAVIVVFTKVVVIVFALYCFICSLSFLANGFRLVAGRQAGEIFANSEVFNNPVSGMLVGVLVTVLVQSSSTSTSIVITMVAADLLTVKQAIPIVMGANIGTSVTSTIVAMTQMGDAGDFMRAFAAATVHDMFNFLSVIVLLPTEAATGYLYRISEFLIQQTPGLESGEKPPDMLKALTKPVTSYVMKLDKNYIKNVAQAQTAAERQALDGERMLVHFFDAGPEDMSDMAAGIIILIAALAILCVSLFVIVYTLKSLLKGRIAVWLHRTANGVIPDLKCGELTVPLGWISGYLAIAVGCLVTICVQSSSITTSALTPLVGVGVIKIERMYPLVLGANIGTCVTGVLAALAASASKLYLTLQVAYAHLLFNLSGIVIFYVIWPLRVLPIQAAKFMGRTTAQYRWFAATYLLFAFFLVPMLFMGLSLWGTAPLVIFIVLCVLVAVFVLVVTLMQKRCPERLPSKLRDWGFLPKFMRSLEPLDRVVCAPLSKYLGRVCPCCKKSDHKKVQLKGKPKPIVSKTETTTIPSDVAIAAQRISQGV